MKKILSFILVLAMILGMTSTVFASYSYQVTTDNTVVPFKDAETNAVTTILRDIGALEGDENGNVNVANKITRAEAITIIVRALGLDDQGKIKTQTKFTDVKKEAWYSGYVAVAVANGFADGVGNNKFNPEANLSMDEAITIILKVLGYDINLEGVWPANYRDLALAKGILTNVEVGSQLATRGDFFQVLYNVLSLTKANQTLVKFNEKTNTFIAPVNSLTLFQKLTRNANYATLSELYKVEGTGVITKDTVFANGFDCSKYVGANVSFVKKAGQIIGLASSTGITLKGQFHRGTVVTFGAVDGTVYTVAPAVLTSTVTRIGNSGVYTSTFIYNEDQDYIISVALDENYSNRIVKVFSEEYWVGESTYVVTASEAAVLATGNYVSVHALGTGVCGVNFETTNTAIDDTTQVFDNTFVVEGAVNKLTDIKANDVVEVYTSEVNPYYVRKIVVVRNMVTGPIKVHNPIAKTIKVNGVDYSFDTNVEDYYFIGAGKELVQSTASDRALLLNSKNEVVYVTAPGFEAVKENITKYAFVRATGFIPAAVNTVLDAEFKPTTASIALIIDGVEKIYNFTPAGLAKTVSVDLITKGSIFNVTPGTLVKLQLNDKDIITSMVAVEKANNDASTMVTPNAIGVQFVEDGFKRAVRYADDVVIIELQDDKFATQSAYYKTVNKSDLIGNPITGAMVFLNNDSRVEFMAYNKSNKEVQVSDDVIITLAAVTGKYEVLVGTKTACYVDFIVDAKKVTYEVIESLYDAMNVGEVYRLRLEDDVVEFAKLYSKIGKGGVGVVSASSVKLEDGYLKLVQPELTVGIKKIKAINANVPMDSKVIVYQISNTKVTVVTEAEVKDAKNVVTFDIDGNGFYDVILIDYLDTNLYSYLPE